MTEASPKFRREPAEQRKEALIEAALSLIAEHGVRGATVRAIAERAEVTQGLIRHHFQTKEDLVAAAYARHMGRMSDETAGPVDRSHGSARARLAAFVVTGLRPPVASPRSVALWASFLNNLRADARMRDIHRQTYHDFRDRLEALIAAALDESGVATTGAARRGLAIACNAVIDGLWLEAGALPEAFGPGELPAIGLASVSAIIGIPLPEPGDMP